jgi:hypothetical protein
LADRFGATRVSQKGQQATFADAPRVFVLSVRNQEANPAAGGQKRKYTTLIRGPDTGHLSAVAQVR